jgi:hypothetical protein
MMITRAIPAADCDHRLRAAIGGGASPCGSGAGPLPSIDVADALLSYAPCGDLSLVYQALGDSAAHHEHGR